jgi:hypothetical protein
MWSHDVSSDRQLINQNLVLAVLIFREGFGLDYLATKHPEKYARYKQMYVFYFSHRKNMDSHSENFQTFFDFRSC